ncbi:MAG: aminoacyl-tRNA hydrolase [Planctomycetaceae bacterium]|nr:aminoacyl-tRNA hydrolase [Planctomycetaceae bacterium]
MPVIVNDQLTVPDTELQFTFSRSGGPGGQNVNKVNSKATLHWFPATTCALQADVIARFLARFASRLTKEGELLLSSQKYRDQQRNVEDCCGRLGAMIESVLKAPVKRRATKPSRGANARRLTEKKVRSEQKQSRRRPRMDD